MPYRKLQLFLNYRSRLCGWLSLWIMRTCKQVNFSSNTITHVFRKEKSGFIKYTSHPALETETGGSLEFTGPSAWSTWGILGQWERHLLRCDTRSHRCLVASTITFTCRHMNQQTHEHVYTHMYTKTHTHPTLDSFTTPLEAMLISLDIFMLGQSTKINTDSEFMVWQMAN